MKESFGAKNLMVKGMRKGLIIKETEKGIIIKFKVQAKAKKNKLAGIHNDAIKISVSSPPVDGAANMACLKYLSALFKVSKSRIEIISGEKNRNKLLFIKGVSREAAVKSLEENGGLKLEEKDLT